MTEKIHTALLLLCSCAMAPALELAGPEGAPEYNRKDWKHWIDEDKDCQDARQEVLVAESTTPVTFEDDRRCRVATGTWEDPYTARTFTTPSSLDVDHVVPLRAAHGSGGSYWTSDRRKDFANDLSNGEALRAVHLGANRSKGSKGPDRWLPVNEAFRCQYIGEYLGIYERWELTMTPAEIAVVDYMLHVCGEGGVPPLPQ